MFPWLDFKPTRELTLGIVVGLVVTALLRAIFLHS